MKDFEEILLDVFDERASNFSDELREMLKQLWREGVKQGLYLERERLPVPKDILKRRPPRNPEKIDEDPRTAPGKVAELETVVENIVQQAESLVCKIESNLDVGPTLALRGEELLKARHRFHTQADKLARDLAALTQFVDRFKIHSF